MVFLIGNIMFKNVLKKRSIDERLVPSRIVCLPIDQYANQDFNYGRNGLIANDLTLLERANTLAECELIAQRLNLYKAENPNTDGLSDSQIAQLIKPRFCQSPAELSRFIDYYYSNHVEPSLQAKQAVEPLPVTDPSPAPVSE